MATASMPVMRKCAILLAWSLTPVVVAQPDTLLKHIQLDEVVISAQATGFSVEAFVKQVREDSTFHKAFLNTRYHPHTMRSALVVVNKGEREVATLYRDSHLLREGPRARQVIDVERETGRLRTRKGEFRYLTAEMYDDVFFPKGTFTADNSVAARKLEVARGSRFEKYKSELKKFMFDPGSEIASVPLIGHKLALFDPHMAPLYDFRIWSDTRNGHACWVFSADAKPEHRDGKTVIKTMDTWFDQESGEVIARQYRIANSSLILDFDITIHVENRHIDGALVPMRVDYDGDWNIPFKKCELVKFQLLYSDWRVVD
ncbi:MAG: hypothetical protein KIT10_06105 [Flavobacteriales bacterium]|nr:hypothetical protein [Flavobacteriales bacterium]